MKNIPKWFQKMVAYEFEGLDQWYLYDVTHIAWKAYKMGRKNPVRRKVVAK